MRILAGQPVRAEKIKRLRLICRQLQQKAQRPVFCVVNVKGPTAGRFYAQALQKLSQLMGVDCRCFWLPQAISEADLLNLLHSLNAAADVNGILLTLPLPANFNQARLVNAIAPEKDLDCLTAINLGRLWQDQALFWPATVKAVADLLTYYQVPVKGQRALILGRSQNVGKPLAAWLLKAGATVTIADSESRNLPSLVHEADLLVSAIGQPHFVQAEWLKLGVNAVDVGTSFVNGHELGDLAASCRIRTDWLTPVPGGVGTLTTICLIEQAIRATRRQYGC